MTPGSLDARVVAVAVNPSSGGGRGAAVGARVLASVRAAGFDVRDVSGRDSADADRRIRAAVGRGCGAVIVGGGDGMVHLALQSLAGTGVPLGIAAAGAGNDLARSLGLPLSGTAWLVDALSAARTRPIDLGRAGDRWYGTVLAAGFDSRVNDRMNRMRWPRGRLRYHAALVRELATFRPLPFRLIVDDRPRSVQAMLVAVGNGRSYGGGMRICPAAVLDDGLFDVTIVHRLGRPRFVRLFPTVYSGRHVRRPEVETLRCRSIEVDCPGVTAYADGERIDSLPVTATVVPAALRVLVPR